jgi:hypothetical protein
MRPAAPTSKELDPAVWWGEGHYGLRGRAYAPIHRLIDRLDPRPGERVLDVACGRRAGSCRGIATVCVDAADHFEVASEVVRAEELLLDAAVGGGPDLLCALAVRQQSADRHPGLFEVARVG